MIEEKKIHFFEFFRFILVGGVATALDWSVFYLLAIKIMLYYQLSLMISFSLACIVNYTFNKLFTFRSKSKKIFRQFSLFSVIAIFSLLLTMILMFIFVDVLFIHKMLSRIFVTMIMLFFNYILHKFLTFNKRFFK